MGHADGTGVDVVNRRAARGSQHVVCSDKASADRCEASVSARGGSLFAAGLVDVSPWACAAPARKNTQPLMSPPRAAIPADLPTELRDFVPLSRGLDRHPVMTVAERHGEIEQAGP